MAQRANAVLKDRASTPVAHTFTPDGEDANGVHVFSEKTGVPASNPRLTIALKSGNGKYRPTLKLVLPVTQVQNINGVTNPVIVRTAYAEVNFTFDSLSNEQERADAVGLLAEALASNQTQFNDLIVKLSDIY